MENVRINLSLIVDSNYQILYTNFMDRKTKIILLFCVVATVITATLFFVVRSDSETAEQENLTPTNTATNTAPQVVTESSGWQKRCLDNNGEKCELFQTININSNGRVSRLSEIALSLREEGGAIMGISLPLGVILNKGIVIKIDEAEAVRLPFKICNASGCHMISSITSDTLGEIKAGNTMNIYFFDSRNNQVNIKYSLDGVTKGIKSL